MVHPVVERDSNNNFRGDVWIFFPLAGYLWHGRKFKVRWLKKSIKKRHKPLQHVENAFFWPPTIFWLFGKFLLLYFYSCSEGVWKKNYSLTPRAKLCWLPFNHTCAQGGKAGSPWAESFLTPSSTAAEKKKRKETAKLAVLDYFLPKWLFFPPKWRK